MQQIQTVKSNTLKNTALFSKWSLAASLYKTPFPTNVHLNHLIITAVFMTTEKSPSADEDHMTRLK